jgi:hypothetical protein
MALAACVAKHARGMTDPRAKTIDWINLPPSCARTVDEAGKLRMFLARSIVDADQWFPVIDLRKGLTELTTHRHLGASDE